MNRNLDAWYTFYRWWKFYGWWQPKLRGVKLGPVTFSRHFDNGVWWNYASFLGWWTLYDGWMRAERRKLAK